MSLVCPTPGNTSDAVMFIISLISFSFDGYRSMEDIQSPIITYSHDLWMITVKWQKLKYDKSEFRHHSIIYEMKILLLFIFMHFMLLSNAEEQILQQLVKESTID